MSVFQSVNCVVLQKLLMSRYSALMCFGVPLCMGKNCSDCWIVLWGTLEGLLLVMF